MFRKCGIHSVNSERRAAIDVLFYAVFEARSKNILVVFYEMWNTWETKYHQRWRYSVHDSSNES